MSSSKRRRQGSNPEFSETKGNDFKHKSFFVDFDVEFLSSKSFAIEKINNGYGLHLSPMQNKTSMPLMPMTINMYQNLPKELERPCMKLFTENMKEFYESSSWGLDTGDKLAELRHENAKYLVVHENDSICAFCHFRFEDEEVLYIWELQVSDEYRGIGLGRLLMSIVEKVALSQGRTKMMLTVFTTNVGARTFYKRLGFKSDRESPRNADYVILFKLPQRKLRRSRISVIKSVVK